MECFDMFRRTQPILVISNFSSPPLMGGMVLATSEKTKDRKFPLGAYPSWPDIILHPNGRKKQSSPGERRSRATDARRTPSQGGFEASSCTSFANWTRGARTRSNSCAKRSAEYANENVEADAPANIKLTHWYLFCVFYGRGASRRKNSVSSSVLFWKVNLVRAQKKGKSWLKGRTALFFTESVTPPITIFQNKLAKEPNKVTRRKLLISVSAHCDTKNLNIR